MVLLNGVNLTTGQPLLLKTEIWLSIKTDKLLIVDKQTLIQMLMEKFYQSKDHYLTSEKVTGVPTNSSTVL